LIYRMKLIFVALALLSFCVFVNSQTTGILGTFFDGACQHPSEYSVETFNSCTNFLGGSIIVSYNGTGGTVSMYTTSCGNPNPSVAVNTSYGANACTPVAGGTSLFVYIGSQYAIWTRFDFYTTNACGASPAITSFTSANYTTASCVPTNCSSYVYGSSLLSCGVTAPQSCPQSTATLQAGSWHQPPCTLQNFANINSLACTSSGVCVTFASNTSAIVNCQGSGTLPTSGGSYIGPNCVGNMSVTPAANYSTSCAPNGAGLWLQAQCVSAPSPSTTTGASTTSGGASTSDSSVITFSVISVLSVLSMFLLSLLL
jgi:hypothetical protein